MREPTTAPVVLAILLSISVAGCNTSPPATQLTATSVRAERRAYDGAPPVIPHEPLGAACTSCHTQSGREVPGKGFAPANPHEGSSFDGATANCRQCHLFSPGDELFDETTFVGLQQEIRPADRMYPGAPPVIPHRVLMRENCLSCHHGPSARPEIRCTHPERSNCKQCHVERETLASRTFVEM